LVATAGFLLSGNKRNKNALRPYSLLDFLSLAAFRNHSRSPYRLVSVVSSTLFLLALLMNIRSWGYGLKIKRKE